MGFLRESSKRVREKLTVGSVIPWDRVLEKPKASQVIESPLLFPLYSDGNSFCHVLLVPPYSCLISHADTWSQGSWPQHSETISLNKYDFP